MTPLLLCQAGTRIPTRNAVAEERARIAREIHDIVSHGLDAMVVLSDAAAIGTSTLWVAILGQTVRPEDHETGFSSRH